MESTPHKKPTTNNQEHHRPSKSDLLSSSKVVAEAAKAALHHETNKIDKGKVAGAAANLLGAASQYGKLEEKGIGKYVGKAENYLQHYHSSHSTTSTTNSTHSTTTAHSTTATHSSTTHSHSSGVDAHTESGFGDYIKMAEGILKKR